MQSIATVCFRAAALATSLLAISICVVTSATAADVTGVPACSKTLPTKLDGLDSPPYATTRTILNYPRRALADKVGGAVVVSIDVTSEGELGGLTIICTEAPGYFEDYLNKMLKKWTFEPAKKGDVAVDFRGLILSFEFDPKRKAGPNVRQHPVTP